MAVRTSMARLIAQVSLLINDPSNTVFTTQQVQDFLDRTQMLVRYDLLTTVPDIVPNGALDAQFNWATYVSRFTDWESDVVIQGRNAPAGSQAWSIITPVSADYQQGRWTFDVTLPTISTSIPAQFPPVFATGKVYDPYLAAAELLEISAAMQQDAFDFQAGDKRFTRSQKFGNRLTLAQTYRRMAKPRSIQLWRSDLQHNSSQQPVHLFGDANEY